MEEIIQYFAENCINRFITAQSALFNEPQKFADFEKSILNAVHDLGKEIIKSTLEEIDQRFRDSPWRKEKWHIESRDTKQLITTMGTVSYRKTLFTSKNEKTAEGKEVMCYLLDKALGFTENQRISEGASARIYSEAVQTSYRKGGEAISDEDRVSKQAVKDLLHNTVFPANYKVAKKKKEVDYLYIDADEDHYALQFINKKGDIETDERGYKKNGAMTKLIYVYEGIEREAPKSKRHRLINTHYFCRGDGDNEALWDEVYAYIEANYEIDRIKKIYLNADGGAWIQPGYKRLNGIKYVLDEFHLSKYLLKMTGHMLDSQSDAKIALCKIIKYGSRQEFKNEAENLRGYTENEKIKERILQAEEYILKNWGAARLRLQRKDGVLACSAEGHVYHVLSSRMSSLAMGWSRQGASKMARLREYYYNGGDMLELVRYQKTQLAKAAGAEELETSMQDMLKANIKKSNKPNREIAKYVNIMTHTLSLQIRKKTSMMINKYI